jgi:hypothetical protein
LPAQVRPRPPDMAGQWEEYFLRVLVNLHMRRICSF